MMELVPAILAGAAGNCISECAKRGCDWLVEKYRPHSPKVQAKAQENAQNYLDRLAQRVERLEKEYPSAKSLIDEALDHPGTALLIQKALISAAATDNETRHALLTELIAQRLTAEPEDNIALIGSAACDVIGSLSTRQIQTLGVMARVFYIPGLKNPPQFPNQNEYDAVLLAWWSALDTLLQGLDQMSGLDLMHLEALSCITINRALIGGIDLTATINRPFANERFFTKTDTFKRQPWYPQFQKIWEGRIQRCSLTSVGILIGTLYHDMALNEHTAVKF
ncbi:LPO_1073/Vpar_1526 family protein [Methanoculleus sp. 7T]|uniref:LPO_1073/Vpar_1526 family protein n=1 Tax=Methanoculleus sp. 7T TaxID=2937282 RepID=UPI0020BED865|nr:LPO_1073/Vpar_1526 family protein [Methanoculleus sp. 7T]MCK8518531.1 hypothetical protein [Methanoculleus sp. 7T]